MLVWENNKTTFTSYNAEGATNQVSNSRLKPASPSSSFLHSGRGVVRLWVRLCISNPPHHPRPSPAQPTRTTISAWNRQNLGKSLPSPLPFSLRAHGRFLWERRETHTHIRTTHAVFISLVLFYKRRRRDRWDSGLLKGVTCADVIRAPGWDSRAPFITM